MDLVGDHLPYRIAICNHLAILLDGTFLGCKDCADTPRQPRPSLCRLEFSSGAGDRNPHWRMRNLNGLGQDVAGGHPERHAVEAERILRPHPGNRLYILIPTHLGDIGSLQKPPNSVHVDERAVPSSRRPLERMSRAAARSAMRTGWLTPGTHTTAPWHRRIRSVCIGKPLQGTTPGPTSGNTPQGSDARRPRRYRSPARPPTSPGPARRNKLRTRSHA